MTDECDRKVTYFDLNTKYFTNPINFFSSWNFAGQRSSKMLRSFVKQSKNGTLKNSKFYAKSVQRQFEQSMIISRIIGWSLEQHERFVCIEKIRLHFKRCAKPTKPVLSLVNDKSLVTLQDSNRVSNQQNPFYPYFSHFSKNKTIFRF